MIHITLLTIYTECYHLIQTYLTFIFNYFTIKGWETSYI